MEELVKVNYGRYTELLVDYALAKEREKVTHDKYVEFKDKYEDMVQSIVSYVCKKCLLKNMLETYENNDESSIRHQLRKSEDELVYFFTNDLDDVCADLEDVISKKELKHKIYIIIFTKLQYYLHSHTFKEVLKQIEIKGFDKKKENK